MSKIKIVEAKKPPAPPAPLHVPSSGYDGETGWGEYGEYEGISPEMEEMLANMRLLKEARDGKQDSPEKRKPAPTPDKHTHNPYGYL